MTNETSKGLQVTYHAFISGQHHRMDLPSMDQAFVTIGANTVTGFDIHRHEFQTPQGEDVTVVSVHGAAGRVLGIYEFARAV
jgi:hypothetical protein